MPGDNPFRAELERRALPRPPNPFKVELERRQNAVPSLPRQFLQGINNYITDALGLTSATATNAILGPIGQALIGGSIKPKDATKEIRKGLKKVGLDTGPLDTTMAKLGESTMQALVTAASLGVAAPQMAALPAAEQGAPLINNILRELSQIVRSRPDVFVAGEIGASQGATLGEEVGGTPGAVVGGLAGGFTGTGTVNIVRGARPAYQTVKSIIKGAPEFIHGGRSLRTPGVGAEEASAGIQARVDDALGRVQRTTERALGTLGTGEAETQQITARRTLEHSRDVARRLERFTWNKVRGRRLKPDTIVSAAKNLKETVADIPPSPLPKKQMDWIKKNLKPGRFVSSKVLIQLRGRLTEAAYRTDDKALLGNIYKLRDAVDTTIQQGAPDTESINYAKEISRRVNELFNTGPVKRILAMRSQREPRVAPRRTVERLLRDPGEPTALRQLSEISVQMRDPRILEDATNAVRTIFRDVAEASPKAAATFLEKNKSVLKDVAPLYAELEGVSGLLTRLSAREAEISKSVFARLSGVDAQKAVQRLFTSNNPAVDAQELMASLHGNRDAINGLKNGVIDEMLRRTGSTGTGAETFLANAKYSRLLQSVLSHEEYGRLERIIQAATAVETGKTSTLVKVLTGGANIIAGVTGAQIGRSVAGRLGGGTVQTPQIFARLTRQLAAGAMKGMDPNELVRRGVIDPAWERILLTRLPDNTGKLARLTKQMRRVIVALDASARVLRRSGSQ